jgi:hypothetical protein
VPRPVMESPSPPKALEAAIVSKSAEKYSSRDVATAAQELSESSIGVYNECFNA